MLNQQKQKQQSFRLSQFQRLRPEIPYIYAVIQALSLVGMQICMRSVSVVIGASLTLAIRGVFLLAINSIVIAQTDKQLNVQNHHNFYLVIRRMIFNCLAVWCFLAPTQYEIEIGVVMSLFKTAPIIIHFLQAVFHHRKIQKIHLMFTIISFFGVVCVIQPEVLFGTPKNRQVQQIIYLIPLAGAFFNAFSMLFLHELKGKISTISALFHFYMAQIGLYSIFMMGSPVDIDQQELTWILGFKMIGLVGFAYIAQYTITRAIMLIEPSKIMPLGYISVIGSSICDILVYGKSLNLLTIIGILLTSVGLLTKLLIKYSQKN